jgi:hypothetical protein
VIVEALLELVRGIVSFIAGVLPDVELPFMAELLEGAGWVSRNLYAFDHFLPVGDLLTFVRFVALTFFPGYLAFIFARFVWSNVPIVGGRG